MCPSNKNLKRILPKILQYGSRKPVPEPTAYSPLSFSQWWRQKTTLLKCQNRFW